MEKVNGYSKNQNVQMLIALMLEHGIKRVVVSPGSTHMEIVGGLQYNGNFKMYSAVDERGAAYMAVGMAADTGEPVAVICTESVASRNYYPAITEAYYRQLPILAITGVHGYEKIGHLHSQIIDRSISPKDTFRLKVQLPVIKDETDLWESNVMINRALLELRRHGGGPVHIDLPWSENMDDFTVKELPCPHIIRRYGVKDSLPVIPQGKIAVFIGTHPDFDEKCTKAIDKFCAIYDAVVFCGHTSGYKGEYRVHSALLAFQQSAEYDIFEDIDLLIHIGNPVADEATMRKLKRIKQVWRISLDGEIRDTFKKLSAVFEMDDEHFFVYYGTLMEGLVQKNYLQRCLSLKENLSYSIDTLPFSNMYASANIAKRLPHNSLIHIGLSTSIRVWGLFEFPCTVRSCANVGTRGIDGVMSSFLGASFVNRDILCFCVLGDLTFFYDLNALGNRHISNNVRVLLVNDGGGGLFKTSTSRNHKFIGDKDNDAFLGAVGHFGKQSPTLVKGLAESLGFEYLTASNKEEFNVACERFLISDMTEKPMIFEIFTKDYEESKAFDMMANIDVTTTGAIKQTVRNILGDDAIKFGKKVFGRK